MANEKHIFIGIGGSGCQTVAMLKAKVYEKRFAEATASKTRLQAMNDSYRFLFIDTDQRDIDDANKRNRESFEQGKMPFINPQTDLINLGRANPQAIYYEAKKDPTTLINKRILEACSPELAVKIPDQPLAFGAGAFRMKSRIAFAHSLPDFQSKLQAAISGLNDVKTVGGEDCIIYYWVIGSTLGGTGSGIFNDVLYHVNQLHHQIVGNGDPQLVLTMYMPKVYIDSNSTEEKYTLNAYAVFSELDAFKSMSYEANQMTVMHRLAFQNDYSLINSNLRYCPFYYLIPVDIQTDKGTSLGTTNTMYRNTAEMLFHLHNGKAGSTFRSDIDNYMNDLMERDHHSFLVPMGYVSLQKPQEQYVKYMRTRFKRDILRSWLLCEDEKSARFEKSQREPLYNDLFEELDPDVSTSIARTFVKSTKTVMNRIAEVDPESEVMDDLLEYGAVMSDLQKVENRFAAESTEEKRDKYKQIIISGLWKKTEVLIREHGLSYTQNALTEVRRYMYERYRQEEQGENSLAKQEQALVAMRQDLQELSDKAATVTTAEKIIKNNKKQIEEYTQLLTEYVQRFERLQIAKWAHDLKRDFCTDEKNDELAKLLKQISNMLDKTAELTRNMVGQYHKLANEFGDTAMDVTTVYLPQLRRICDGNGWIQGNMFSKLYSQLITAQEDREETPDRLDLKKFLEKNIYLTGDDQVREELYKGQYVLFLEKKDAAPDDPQKKIEDTRFFANPKLIENSVSTEKIIEDFLAIAVKIFEKKMHEDSTIQELWDNKKISAFFSELTNDEKDEVRRSLNPALFFSYNANRIDVMKREEHVVFVAGSEDLAEEMLGFQKGNPKHRFEKADNENTALVLKSKYGLSLSDYRIYDSIKMVYDKATFREKYHFHHDFAQFLDKLTLENLPYDILPQHRAFVKMLILDSFSKELKDFFYSDPYEQQIYMNTMYFSDYEKSFMIALPEAFLIHPATGKLVLRREAEGRNLYLEIEGNEFADRFRKYCDLYYNYGFGETTENLIQAILRLTITVSGKQVTGESVFKAHYTAKHEALLKDISEKKRLATLPEEKRLYGIFFNILRDELDTVHKFIR